jgi:hypothetical protein
MNEENQKPGECRSLKGFAGFFDCRQLQGAFERCRRSAVRNRLFCWLKFGVTSAVAYFSAICNPANATLIMGTYNNGTLYVASDSCMTYQNGNTIQQFKVPKLFKISDYCCVSICNNYGGFVRIPQSTNVAFCLFPEQLANLCAQSNFETNDEIKIATVNARFATIYANFLLNCVSKTDLETRLTYWGYDRSAQRFFVDSYLFDPSTGTNIPTRVVAFRRGNESIGTPLTLTAEVGFLSALIFPVASHSVDSSDDKLAPLRTVAFRQEVEQVFQETPMEPDRIVQFMLELFELHKNHAQHFDYDKGWIDEPYVFFLVTTNGNIIKSFVHRQKTADQASDR